jgi:hypothetical protein
MTLRLAHEDAILTGGEIAVIREALAACSHLLGWAGQHDDPQFRGAAAAATEAAGLSRSPAGLAYHVSLAIDYLDFAPAARRMR